MDHCGVTFKKGFGSWGCHYELADSWREIAEAHPLVKSASGRKVKPSVGSIRRAFAQAEVAKSRR